jgi:epoxyqueuosine reductase
MQLTSALIKERAAVLGFDLCGIAPAVEHSELAFLRHWIARGFAGEMRYLARSADRRGDVRCVLASTRSVISLATNYNVDRPYSTERSDRGEALISRYAWGDDYHDVIGRRLESLLAWMRDTSDQPFEAKPYVDTGHVQERVYARHAGLGWIGKNTCLINPEMGSWLFLSEILCSLELEPDEPVFDHCGSCTLCLEVCPTGALIEPGVLDSRRCISYLTIELKGPMPEAWRAAAGRHVYGCDVCQEVCPYNQDPPRSEDPAWQPRAAFDRAQLTDLAARDDEELRTIMHGSATRRAGLKGLRRNIEVAISNSSPAAREREV